MWMKLSRCSLALVGASPFQATSDPPLSRSTVNIGCATRRTVGPCAAISPNTESSKNGMSSLQISMTVMASSDFVPAAGGTKSLEAITVIEICNDDMPFLLDSVLGEIAAQGPTVRLVAHPMFTVERDKGGSLVAWKGEAPTKAKEQRESFIHIHIECIDQERAAAMERALQVTLGEV